MARNQAIVAPLRRMAQEKQCTPAQLALAWLLAQGAFGARYTDEGMKGVDA